MEHTSDVVSIGKLIHENSYEQRADRYTEIELSYALSDEDTLFGKVDFYDAKNKMIHETKKSDKLEWTHEWQVKFYLWLFMLNGIEGVKALLEYPKQRQTKEVVLTNDDIENLKRVVEEVKRIPNLGKAPNRINKPYCKQCAYYEFCYVEEGT